MARVFPSFSTRFRTSDECLPVILKNKIISVTPVRWPLMDSHHQEEVDAWTSGAVTEEEPVLSFHSHSHSLPRMPSL